MMSKAKRNLRAKVNRNIERKMEQAMKATPPDELYEYLMDSNIPKSEAEHFAADRIDYLEGVCESQQASNESLAKIIEELEAKLKRIEDRMKTIKAGSEPPYDNLLQRDRNTVHIG
jgi:hypothetical protein